MVGNRAMLMLSLGSSSTISTDSFFNLRKTTFPIVKRLQPRNKQTTQNYSTANSNLEPPDVPRLAETARISLTPDEVEEFAPKIRQVVDWFSQLQAVDLQSIEPAIRADADRENLRDDLPETFENREAITSAMPSFEEPFIKVPKVLNKE